MKNWIVGALASVTLFAVAAPKASAMELVTNGGFEMSPPDFAWESAGAPAFGDWSPYYPAMTTNSVWLGGYDVADDAIGQDIDLGATPTTAILEFDLGVDPVDVTGYDFFYVGIGSTTIDTIDMGDDFSYEFIGPYRLSYDISDLTGTGVQTLWFAATTDEVYASSAFVDNVSVEAGVVPEPASIAVLSLGLLAAFRRRR